VIRGELLNLRAAERGDALLLHRWLNDPDVMRGWGSPDHTVSLAEIGQRLESWLQEEAALGRPSCLLAETLEGEPVGFALISLYQSEPRAVELSLMIGDPTRWGQGLGGDLLRAILGACFETWGLHRVWLRTEAGNARAHRLYQANGFVHEGTLREAAFLDGRHENVLVYGLLAPEWLAGEDRD
jgi:RimJ/RimL family protein N-acetyltransferase